MIMIRSAMLYRRQHACCAGLHRDIDAAIDRRLSCASAPPEVQRTATLTPMLVEETEVTGQCGIDELMMVGCGAAILILSLANAVGEAEAMATKASAVARRETNMRTPFYKTAEDAALSPTAR